MSPGRAAGGRPRRPGGCRRVASGCAARPGWPSCRTGRRAPLPSRGGPRPPPAGGWRSGPRRRRRRPPRPPPSPRASRAWAGSPCRCAGRSPSRRSFYRGTGLGQGPWATISFCRGVVRRPEPSRIPPRMARPSLTELRSPSAHCAAAAPPCEIHGGLRSISLRDSPRSRPPPSHDEGRGHGGSRSEIERRPPSMASRQHTSHG
jgi:hypothetical protein